MTRRTSPRLLWLALLPACVTEGDESLYTCRGQASGPGDGVELLSPGGGEVFTGGDAIEVIWAAAGEIDAVDVDLLREGELVVELARDADPSGSLTWIVPFDLVSSDEYTVQVRDTGGRSSDESAAPFSVANWRYRRTISVSSPAVLTDHALLVEISAGGYAFDRALPGGADVRFASAADRAGGFDLPHYIEQFSESDGVRVWVRLPEITAGTSTFVYMFYGNPSASDASSFADTFPSSFISDGDAELGGVQVFDWFELRAGHTLTAQPGAALEIRAPAILVAGTIDGAAAGYGGGLGEQVGDGPGGGGFSINAGAGGGGYGGGGGNGGYDPGDTEALGGVVYGSPTGFDLDMGSGGGGSAFANGGAGGGAIILRAQRAVVTGTLIVDGQDGGANPGNQNRGGGGGAGGGVLIRGLRVAVSGTMSARGGGGGNGTMPAHDGGGGGGGGRIKVFFADTVSNTGTYLLAGGDGGVGGDERDGLPGDPGTLHVVNAAASEPSTLIGAELSLF